MASGSSRPELLVIVGETASGKSDLALKIAKAYRGEIISADSWTVYRGFDIGTGKPTTTQQKAVKHHLIDVREATEGFNAPMFKEMAEKAIADVQNRGKLPIMVGGTGLYIDSVLYDYGFLPNVSTAERAELDAKSINELIGLAQEQQINLSRIDVRNKRRIVRAIEARGEKPTKRSMISGTLLVGLRLPSEELKERIKKRVDQMVADGFEQEVKSLTSTYGWDIEPMKGIGYRAFRDYIEGKESLDEAKQKFIKGDLNLAKKQRTWFKKNKDIHWYSSAKQAFEFVSGVLNN